jgi:hypothetical protein
MINETLQFILSHTDTINPISAIIIAISTAVGALLIIWVAYFSPQAVQAKIEKVKYFQQERQKHYTQLNSEIFKPLSKHLFNLRQSVSFPESELLKLEFKPEINTLFEEGLFHLDRDYPGFDKEIKEFRREVNNFNEKLLLFYGSLDSKIKQEFSDLMEISDNYEFIQKYNVLGIKPVKEIILICLSTHLKSISQYDKNSIKDSSNRAIMSYHTAQISLDGKTPFQIFGYTITNLPFIGFPSDHVDIFGDVSESYIELKRDSDQKKQQIIDHLCEIIAREDVFIPFREILTTRDQLIIKEKQFSNKIEKISILIDNLRYKTVALCCTDKKFL